MDQDVVFVHSQSMKDVISGVEYAHEDLTITRIIKGLMPVLSNWLVTCLHHVCHIVDFLKRLSHNVDVIDVSKSDSTIRIGSVRTTVFISSTFEFIGACVKERPGIKDFNKATLVLLSAVTKAYVADQLFIAFTPCTPDKSTRLTASPDRGSRNCVKKCQSRQTIRWSESSTLFDSGLIG